MAVNACFFEKEVNPRCFLQNMGIPLDETWFNPVEKSVLMFSEEWEKLKDILGWSPVATAGQFGGWTYSAIPKEDDVC